MTLREIKQAAVLQAGEMVSYPESERDVSVDPIPGDTKHRMVSVAKKSEIHRLMNIVTEAALIPHAIDGPLAAWDRLCPSADAILDLYQGCPHLIIRRNPHPTGTSHMFAQGMQPDRIAKEVLDQLRKARELHAKLVERIIIYGPEELSKRVRDRMTTADKSLTIEPLMIGDIESPPWAYALALATWDIEPRPIELREAA
jgi:hypothetical protein